MMALLQSWWWQIVAGLSAVVAFLVMLLRLRRTQERAEQFRRRADTEAEKARSARAVEKARRKARRNAREVSRGTQERYDRGRRPTGRFGDRL